MTRSAAIVTGGRSGLGLAISRTLVQRGISVVAMGPEPDAYSRQADEISAQADDFDVFDGDVSRERDVADAVTFAIERHGHVDFLINNAAIGPLGTIEQTGAELWDKIFAVNVKGPYLMSRTVIPHMAQQGGGRIVNVGSGAAYGKSNMIAYAASKGALLSFSAALARDHFHQKIRVNTVIPGGGGIRSGMSLARVGGDESTFGRYAIGTAAGRVASGNDLAKAVAFLLSEEASVISGAVLDVGCFSGQGGLPGSVR